MNAGPMVLLFTIGRYRWLFAVTVAYLAMLCVVGQMPVSSVPAWAAGLLTVPFFGVLFGTIFSFVNFEADFASTSSAYHPYLLRLPVRTWVLVLWPTVTVSVWSFGIWVALCAFYFHPRGVSMPMFWPAAMFAALALCMQSILWVPVRIGGMRLFAALLIPVTVALFGLFASSFGWHEDRIAYIYLCIAVGSLGFAWFGVDRARTSPPGRVAQAAADQPVAIDDLKRKVKPAFRSAAEAQFWLEWRRQGRILPIATAVVFGLFTVPILLNREMVEASVNGQPLMVNVYVWPMLPILPWIPLLMATAIGMGSRRSDMRGSDGVYHLYHATRPLDEEDIYRAKVRAITAGVVATVVLTLGFLGLWLGQPAHWNDRTLPLWAVLIHILTQKDLQLYGAITIVIAAWMWRNQVVGAFVDYVTSRFLAQIYPLLVTVFAVGWLVVTSLCSQYLQSDGGRVALSIVLGVALVAKLGVTGWYGRQLVQQRPAAKQVLAWSLVKWIAAAGASAAALYWIAVRLDGGANPPYFVRMPVPILLGLLIVPLARPTVARWALYTGRHR